MTQHTRTDERRDAEKPITARSFLDGFVWRVVVLAIGAVLVLLITPWIGPMLDRNERVPDMYDEPRDVGRAMLIEKGFSDFEFIDVCSNSVDSGLIREVVLRNGAQEHVETSLVNEYVNTDNTPVFDIPKSTPLRVSVSSGDCARRSSE